MKSNLFSRIIWKNAKSHLREMRVLILCVTVLISAMYAMLSRFVLFSKEHSYEEVLLAEDGISRIFVSAGFMLLLCGIVLIIVVLFSYLGKRIPDYIFFQRMGISREDKRRMIRAEGGITYLIAIALGFVLGTLLSALLRIFLRRTGVLSVTTAMTSPLLYLPVCAAALFIFLSGFCLSE
jgi:ABC-type antimicrobial peptide transport system permease subunit